MNRSESIQNTERVQITDDEVFTDLKRQKELGPIDSQTKRKLEIWCEYHQEEADLIGREDVAGTNLPRLRCAIRREIIYYKAGYVDEAVGQLEETEECLRNIVEPCSEAEKAYKYVLDLLRKMKAGESIR